MTANNNGSRRSFLKIGALLATPIIAAAPGVAVADDGLRARLARLEDEVAIRALHQKWLDRINSREDDAVAALFRNPAKAMLEPGLCAITSDDGWDQQAITISQDAKHAAGIFRCNVEIESALPQDSTFAQMAYAQGNGALRRTEKRVVHMGYTRTPDGWAFDTVRFLS